MDKILRCALIFLAAIADCRCGFLRTDVSLFGNKGSTVAQDLAHNHSTTAPFGRDVADLWALTKNAKVASRILHMLTILLHFVCEHLNLVAFCFRGGYRSF
jgi:hypothetical protein